MPAYKCIPKNKDDWIWIIIAINWLLKIQGDAQHSKMQKCAAHYTKQWGQHMINPNS